MLAVTGCLCVGVWRQAGGREYRPKRSFWTAISIEPASECRPKYDPPLVGPTRVFIRLATRPLDTNPQIRIPERDSDILGRQPANTLIRPQGRLYILTLTDKGHRHTVLDHST